MSKLQLRRDFTVQDVTETDGVFEIAFSSESPVSREIIGEYGEFKTVNEILVHDGPENADLTRLNNSASLLFNHDFDKHIGVVLNARIDSDRIGRATVKFSSVGELANEIKAKVSEGTISKISFGYDLDEYEIRGDDLLVTRWSPYEISFVTVPADDNVGLGRALNISEQRINADPNKNSGNKKMTKRTKRIDEYSVEELVDMTIEDIEALSDEDRKYRDSVLVDDAEKEEKLTDEENADYDKENGDAAGAKVEDKKAEEISDEERADEAEEILEVAARYKVPQKEVARALAKNMTARQFKRSIKPQAPTVITKMTKDNKDTLEKRFSLDNVVRALMDGKQLRGAEAEYHQEMSRRALGRGAALRGFHIPASAMRAGQTTVNLSPITDEVVRYDSFVEMLLAQSVLPKLGVNVLSGLKTPIAIPRQTKSSVDAFGFVSENGKSPEGTSEFDNIQMRPHTFTGGNPLSRQALLTVPNIGAYIADHIVKFSRIKLEKMLFGAGAATASAPAGILNGLTEIQNGMGYKDFLGVTSGLVDAGVDSSAIKYAMTGSQEAELMSTLRDQNVSDYIVSDDHKLGGYDVHTSGVLAPNKVLVGDFSAITIGEWEGMTLDLDDTTYRDSGAVVPRVWCDIDWAVTNPDALALIGKKAASK